MRWRPNYTKNEIRACGYKQGHEYRARISRHYPFWPFWNVHVTMGGDVRINTALSLSGAVRKAHEILDKLPVSPRDETLLANDANHVERMIERGE